MDYCKEFNVTELDARGIDTLRKKLQADENLRERYMVKKLGFNPDSKKERARAMDIYQEKGLAVEVSPGVYSTWNEICLMTKNINVDEYTACTLKDTTMKKQAPVSKPADAKKSNRLSDYQSYAKFLQ